MNSSETLDAVVETGRTANAAAEVALLAAERAVVVGSNIEESVSAAVEEVRTLASEQSLQSGEEAESGRGFQWKILLALLFVVVGGAGGMFYLVDQNGEIQEQVQQTQQLLRSVEEYSAAVYSGQEATLGQERALQMKLQQQLQQQSTDLQETRQQLVAQQRQVSEALSLLQKQRDLIQTGLQRGEESDQQLRMQFSEMMQATVRLEDRVSIEMKKVGAQMGQLRQTAEERVEPRKPERSRPQYQRESRTERRVLPLFDNSQPRTYRFP